MTNPRFGMFSASEIAIKIAENIRESKDIAILDGGTMAIIKFPTSGNRIALSWQAVMEVSDWLDKHHDNVSAVVKLRDILQTAIQKHMKTAGN